MFGQHIFTMPCRDNGTQRNLILRLSQLPSSSLPHLAHILSIIAIYGDSSFPGPGLLSKFQAVKGEVKVFLESAGSWLFSAQNSLHTKVTHFGETCSDPRNYGNTFDLSLSLHFVLWSIWDKRLGLSGPHPSSESWCLCLPAQKDCTSCIGPPPPMSYSIITNILNP